MADRPAAFVLFGLYGVAVLLLVGVVLLITTSKGFKSRRFRRIARMLIAVTGVALLARGIAFEVLLSLNTGGLRNSVGSLESRWSFIIWNPWFVLGGALFLWTALRIRRR
jgi:cytochrome bd-type quinol oxidase subunit 2